VIISYTLRCMVNFCLSRIALFLGITAFVALILTVSPPIYADSDNGSSQRGRHIFFKGEKSNGEPITANVGAASIPVPATALTCSGCHGRDGKGREEGGVKPSDITWFNLTKGYGGTTSIGRQYNTYDASSFLVAVTAGIDSAGNKLDSSMPRFNIARQDARDLVAYLKVIQDDFDPGIAKHEMVFGSLQPKNQVQARVANAMVEVIQAKFDEVNQQGGIYGRKLKLKSLPYEDRQSFIAQANKLISGDQVFALLNAFSASADGSLVDMVEEAEIPSIAPYTQFPAAEDRGYNYTFYLYGGLDTQIAALAKRAGASEKNTGKAIVFYRKEGRFENNARQAIDYFKQYKIENVQLVAYESKASGNFSELIDLQNDPNPVILFLGSSSDLVRLLGPPGQRPGLAHLMFPGFFVNSDIIKLAGDYAEQLEMAYLTVPDGNRGETLSKFRQFMRRNQLDYNYLTARLFAYGATQTLIEGVKRAGKQISRQKFVAAVEQIYAFDVGLNQPVSYGSRRRTGVLGAYMVKLDSSNKRLSPTGKWIRVD